MKRPDGIIVVVIFGFMAALFLIIGGLFDLNLAMRSDADWGGTGLIVNLGPAPGAVMLALAACFIVLCSGLGMLKEWARLFTIYFVCLTTFILLVGTLRLLALGFFAIGPLAVNGVIFWYLSQADVKDKFS